jgi:hypothetical protein
MPISFTIDGILYRSKKELETKIRRLLDENIGKKITNDVDHQFIAALLMRHPDAKKMIGNGIGSFTVRPYEGSRCFFHTRSDGTETSFSYISCIKSKCKHDECTSSLRCLRKDIETAFRHEIQDQIDEYRQKETCPKWCPLCHEEINMSHIDHDPIPFITLCNDFINQFSSLDVFVIKGHGSDESRIDSPYAKTNLHSLWIENRDIAKQWKEYHKQHCHLRFICKSCNLRLPKQTWKRQKI